LGKGVGFLTIHFNPIEVEEYFLSAIVQFKIMNYNLLENWITEMNGGDLSRLTSLYSKDAILFATFDEQPLDTTALIHGYFKSFFSLRVREWNWILQPLRIRYWVKTVIPRPVFTHFFSWKTVI
jgi:hypothetical protein